MGESFNPTQPPVIDIWRKEQHIKRFVVCMFSGFFKAGKYRIITIIFEISKMMIIEQWLGFETNVTYCSRRRTTKN